MIFVIMADDERAGALIYLCSILEQLSETQRPNFICLENVPGFHQSNTHKLWIETLKKCGYYFFEFLLTPTQFGIPNERIRYFCAARKVPWQQIEYETITSKIPGDITMHEKTEIEDHSQFYSITGKEYFLKNAERSDTYFSNCQPLLHYLDSVEWDESAVVPEYFVTRCAKYKHDFVNPRYKRSSCFTSGYSQNARGAGSILYLNYDELSEEELEQVPLLTHEIVQKCKVRFFTPREILKLMSFPDSFLLPDNIKLERKYKLIGNSISVICGARVLAFLFSE